MSESRAKLRVKKRRSFHITPENMKLLRAQAKIQDRSVNYVLNKIIDKERLS